MLAEALDRMPHRGRMRLIAEILAADADRVRCRAADHHALDYPLRIGGLLRGATLVELGAQAAAVHASLYAVGQAHTGLVLALSDIAVTADVVESERPLEANAERIFAQEDAASYRFEVTGSGGPFVSGELLLSMRSREP